MMGMQQSPQSSLFYIGINIDKRVRSNHSLRRVKQLIDFDFAYNEIKDRYGTNGNVSECIAECQAYTFHMLKKLHS